MEVNTRKVKGRRSVRYSSLNEFLLEAKQLAETPVRTLGNWSQGQIYMHLARAMDGSIDGVEMSVPAPMRWIMILLFKKRFLENGLPAGFPAPDGPMKPEATSTAEGLAALQRAVDRQNLETARVPHPAFGKLDQEGWGRFHLRHAEMHMSFIVVEDAHAADGDSSDS